MVGGTSYKDSLYESQAGTGLFIVTLCELAAPVTIRPPQAAHLRALTFFVGHADLADGRQQLYLNMGYFRTLAAAQECVQRVQGRYPNATTRPASAVVRESATAAGQGPETMTDTQVMQVLSTRGVSAPADQALEEQSARVSLLRPDETSTLRALKTAVAVGAPVSFAVQLQWSDQPVNLSRIPSLAPFKERTMYVTESYRGGRARYFVRLGFFTDPASANEVACLVRARFASAAVVPITEQEVARAMDPASQFAAIPNGGQAADVRPVPPRLISPKPATNESAAARPDAEILSQSLEKLAEQEVWADPDSISESGVRHLKVEVQRRNFRN
jgi:hypothetical protein